MNLHKSGYSYEFIMNAEPKTIGNIMYYQHVLILGQEKQ